MMRLALLLLVLLVGPLQAEPSRPLASSEARLLILHDHGNPVVAEMVRLTLRGEYDLTVSLEDLRFPDSESYDWMQIDRDRWFKERIGGRMIQVFERDIALFPRRAGMLTVPAITHDLTHVLDKGMREKRSVTSAPAQITVRPYPGDRRPLAAHALVLTDELSAEPGKLQKDEVLTRRVTIEALGALAHHLPPRPDLQQPWLISFTQPELRETIPTPQGPVSRVVWEWQLRPRTGEPGVLPAVAFPWFDTDSRQMEVAPMKPIPFGFAGFGNNFGAREADGVRFRLILTALVALAFGAALTACLWDRIPSLAPLLRAVRRSPHLAEMEQAVRTGDLHALRAAAARHLAWRGQTTVRQSRLLGQLDNSIFGPKRSDDLDLARWLTQFRR
nr:BatD family protein [Paracoccus saliphilus]